MLAIIITNDGTGEPADLIGHYDYEVYVNFKKIATGRVEEHPRRQGWKELLKSISFNKHTSTYEEELDEALVKYIKKIKG